MPSLLAIVLSIVGLILAHHLHATLGSRQDTLSRLAVRPLTRPPRRPDGRYTRGERLRACASWTVVGFALTLLAYGLSQLVDRWPATSFPSMLTTTMVLVASVGVPLALGRALWHLVAATRAPVTVTEPEDHASEALDRRP